MDNREAKLPTWAKELLACLRKQIEQGQEPLVRELNRLRPQMELLRLREAAMTELLDCAAKGGHKSAQEIMDIIRAYNLTLTPEDRR